MNLSGWSNEERAEAWVMECAKPEYYVRSAGAVEYTGPTPQLCACGEYHAPRELCPIFGDLFTPWPKR